MTEILWCGDDNGVHRVVTHHHVLLLLCVHCDLINVFVVSMVAAQGHRGGSLLRASSKRHISRRTVTTLICRHFSYLLRSSRRLTLSYPVLHQEAHVS